MPCKWGCHGGIFHHAAGAKSQETAFSWTNGVPLFLHSWGSGGEECRKPSCSNKEGTAGTTALRSCLKWQRGSLIHSWKSLCNLSILWCLTDDSQSPVTLHNMSEPLSRAAITFIRKPHFPAYQLQPQLLTLYRPCPVSEQTYGLIPWKTFSDLPPIPAVTLWFFLGRGRCRTTVISCHYRDRLQG